MFSGGFKNQRLYFFSIHGWSPGQTIIEVLVATLIVSLVMTTIAAGMTFSVRSTAESKFRNLGSSLAQQGLETFRENRALLGWTRFKEAVASGTFCINELPTTTAAFVAMTASDCTSGAVIAGTEFTREALVDVQSETKVRVEISVKWYSGDIQKNVTVVQEFQQYE